MAEEQTNLGEAKPAANETKSTRVTWLDALKALAIPLVTLILGFVFNASLNSRQERESNIRLYTEMMGRREQADSDLRKDMFKSILDTFMRKDPKLELDEQLNQEVLNLELFGTHRFAKKGKCPTLTRNLPIARRFPNGNAVHPAASRHAVFNAEHRTMKAR